MHEPAVVVDGLAVRRGRAAVFDGIGFRIPRGEVTGLLGPSGCGKTTLLRSIVGVQAGVRGRIEVLGSPAGSPALRTRVAYATQAASVYDDLTVRQNLRFFARVVGAPSGDAERTIELVGLTAQADRRVDALSGGQRGRVSLAVALLGSPELVVLDEPTVGLDPVLRAELWTLFRRLAADGATLIVSSHVMDEALRCDRLLLLRDGQLVADTTPADLLASTGTTDPEAAFLAIIASEHGSAADPEQAQDPSRASEASQDPQPSRAPHPRHGAEADA
ncbi:ABC transporter ATP-binding protein [Leucobacter rhizosphaerae]|uniref:ABC transporter ATP-binding protein n=1 Tax=Leucobacter rhizosphaerae TaxID=2932245 RepID=A0ABY4FUC7_9MICO|nr:ABC transporter ATP-binding protein [Leucobacter rhizosphaerae]UOQ59865.1 ABC transporter ATP-binding protein [Leucobacter rhizosphaerae]